MKKILFIIIITCGAVKTMGQSTSKNYILTTIPTTFVTDPGSLTNANSNSTIQYIDGLGRQVETVQKAITPSGKDLINIIEYDGMGREYRHWSPVPATGSTGDYVNIADFTSSATTQYGSAEQPYATTEFEPSPLNRVTGEYSAGKAWYDATKKVKTEYGTNTSSTEVVCFLVNTSNQLERKNYYPVHSLYKIVTTDEDGKTTTEYKDKLGQILLKRNEEGGAHVDTYYVYNDFGQLCYVIPPKAVDELTDFSVDNAIMKQYCYLYRYDERGNCIYKRLPGCEPIYMVYDKTNRLLLSQDGNQRPYGKWTMNKYDILGRVIYMAVLIDAETTYEEELERFRDATVVEWYNTPNAQSDPMKDTGYSTGWYSATSQRLLTVNYYDDYSFLDLIPSQKASLTYDTSKEQEGYAAQYSNVKGMLTGTRIYHLDDSTKYEATALYYDKYGRVVQTRATNHLGGYDITYNALDFMGKPTRTYKTHGINGASDNITELYTYDYDKAQRLTTTKYSLNGGSLITMAVNTYDELGRLSTKNLGGVDVTTYGYNIRNWTTGITGSRFSENLYYNDNTAGLPSFTPAYNGNIAGMQWNVPNESLAYNRAYTFAYDGLNRLTNANYYGISNGSVIDGTSGRYNETFTFDKMGNFNSLTRYENGSLLNNLSFTYTGNQLKKVDNSISPYIPYGSEAFNDRQKITTEYYYDQNGSTTADVNSGISTIQYNLLNLPDQIQFTEGHKNMYTYDARGKKLETVNYTVHNIVNVPINTISTLPANPSDYTKLTTDYVGNMIYENGALKEILLPEGYYQNGVYYYYLKDHLGNNRVVINSSGAVMEKSHYYPSGMRFSPESTSNSAALPYRYNGKELEAMNGLNQMDYGARRRGAGLPVWTAVDPLAEKYYSISPYAYCAGNPVNRIDPDGRSGEAVIDKKNKTITVSQHLVFYGSKANSDLSKKIATGIASQWNGAHGKVKINGEKFAVKFTVTYETVSVDKAKKMAANNTDIKNNFIQVNDLGGKKSSGFEKGGNAGYFNIQDDLGGSTTPAHEIGHGLGLDHSETGQTKEERPHIMTPRGTEVNPRWSKAGPSNEIDPNFRRVSGSEVHDIFNGVTFYNGVGKIGETTNTIYNEQKDE